MHSVNFDWTNQMSEVNLKHIEYVKTPDGYKESYDEPQSLKGINNFGVIDYEDLRQRFVEGNDTYDRKMGESGRRYETIVFNAGQLTTARVVKISTSYSSALKNPANVLETALAATLNPEAAYIYIASFGNYPTGLMEHEDLKYVTKTGRYTKGLGTDDDPYRPLNSVEDMAATLDDNNLSPTHIAVDEEAARPALGLMHAAKPNSIKAAYLNGPDGISPTDNYVMAQFSDDIRSRIYRRKLEDVDPGLLTPASIKDIKQNMPKIYHGIGRIAHLAPLPVLLFPKDDWNKAHLVMGYKGHNDLENPQEHAIFQDTQAALRRQEAVITMQFNTESAFTNLRDVRKFGKMTMEALPEEMKDGKRKIRIIIGEGTHNAHTDDPYGRSRVERYLLSDITQKMIALAGGLAIDRYILGMAETKAA
jgi:hypothetical protein